MNLRNPEAKPPPKLGLKLWFTRGLILTGILLILLIAWGWVFSWKRLPYYANYPTIQLPVPIMTGNEYDSVINLHARPYVIELESGGGRVVVFGAEHTKDPNDPQIAEIEALWSGLKPTVALCESRLGILFPGLMDPVKEFSEPGFVHQLARRDRIPTYTWEPSPEIVINHLLRLPFTREQIALRIKLGPYFSNLRYGKPNDPDATVLDYIGDSERWPGLENALTSIGEIDAEWRRHFPAGPDWRDVSDQHGLPGFLSDISTNEVRDEHFIRVIIDLVTKGERVFAVAGSSHAVKLDPALKGYFRSSTGVELD